jgi:hypothetical protein
MKVVDDTRSNHRMETRVFTIKQTASMEPIWRAIVDKDEPSRNEVDPKIRAS